MARFHRRRRRNRSKTVKTVSPLKSAVPTVWPRDGLLPPMDLIIVCSNSESNTLTSSSCNNNEETNSNGNGNGNGEQNNWHHHHKAHSFVFYLLSPFFQKAILFSNLNNDDNDHEQLETSILFSSKIKKLILPFSCQAIEEVINFCYDGKCQLSERNVDELKRFAEFTFSIRLMRYLENASRSDANKALGLSSTNESHDLASTKPETRNDQLPPQ